MNERAKIKAASRQMSNVRAESFLEARFALHIRAHKLPAPTREYCFDPDRGWRLDFAWPALKIAVETEGKVHAIGAQHEKDCEKFAAALLAGWRVLRVTYKQVQSGQAIQWIQTLLQQENCNDQTGKHHD